MNAGTKSATRSRGIFWARYRPVPAASRDPRCLVATGLILASMVGWVVGGQGLPLHLAVTQILLLSVTVRLWRTPAASTASFAVGLAILIAGTGTFVGDLPKASASVDESGLAAIMSNRWAASAYVLGLWALAWVITERTTQQAFAQRGGPDSPWPRVFSLLQPLFFGLWMLVLWEISVRLFQVSTVLLPPPSLIVETFAGNLPTLYEDFVQTIIRAVLPGYALGCLLGLAAAFAVDRSDFLRRGLVPMGSFMSSLPLVGIAPIAVMWFGFDWPSKVAVVVVMTFFPMFVNLVTGLEQTTRLERDLLKSWGATPWQGLMRLRFPGALPFFFNALKINSTLSIIGAIVAEFFGTPIVGVGFRISSEVGRLNIPMVWAAILLAMICGCCFYGAVVIVERRFTFWTPAMRALSADRRKALR